MKFRVVIHPHTGAFSLSYKALSEYRKLTGKNDEYLGLFGANISRTDHNLIHIVEKLKEKACGPYSISLEIVEIPLEYYGCIIIDDTDGKEKIIYDTSRMLLFQSFSFLPISKNKKRIENLLENPFNYVY